MHEDEGKGRENRMNNGKLCQSNTEWFYSWMMFYCIIYRNVLYAVGFGIMNISLLLHCLRPNNMLSKPWHNINLSRFLSGLKLTLHDTRMRFNSIYVCVRVFVNVPSVFLFSYPAKNKENNGKCEKA